MVIRDLFDELQRGEFKQVTFTIYNRIDDEYFVRSLNKKHNDIFSVDDFVYYDFDLTDKEKFLLKMYNKEIFTAIRALKAKIKDCDELKLYVEQDKGIIRVVKLKKFNLYDLCLQCEN